MKIESKKETESKTKKEQPLSDEFKEEIKNERAKRISPAVWILILLILGIFGSLGYGTYQIFYKPEKVEQLKQNSEKIENSPSVEETQKPQEQKPAETPALQTTTPPPAATPPAQKTTTNYTVQSGDTWSSIANANGMTSKELMDYNASTSEDLQIGQVIKIPAQ